MNLELMIQFLLAAVWGGLVGAEREYHGKSAGFRTMIMISVGSCFFTMLSGWIGAPESSDRIAANIVTGIGFLGAGVIFRGDHKINGITTAATIWAVAAVGMGIGGGYYFASALASIAVLIILAILPAMEKWIDQLNQFKVYTICCDYSPDIMQHIETIIQEHQLKSKLILFTREERSLTLLYQVRGTVKRQRKLVETLLQIEWIRKFQN